MKRDRQSQSTTHDAAQLGQARRVVLIGASNLTMGIGTVLPLAKRIWGGPLQVYAALGHGRSYGAPSRIFGRQLPGILESGLWPALAEAPPAATAALVTDIGNDILYQYPVERIAGWVEAVLDALADAQARTVVTLLPADNLHTLGPARFALVRSVLVPSCRLSLATIAERVRALNDEVQRLAAEREFSVVAQCPTWYGFDPIHIRFTRRRRAWAEILSPWSDAPAAAPMARGSLLKALYLQSRVPERRRVWGFAQQRQQPAARFADGTTVAIY